ncbi:MAG: nitrate reductase [Rhodospirillaceae bacterium]|jgi:periplasmic nitrate reductase NapE|nr:nitrate reductase [Rhodospirillaceae bacterium]
MNQSTEPIAQERSMGSEFKAFLFATVFLAPILSIALVGGYGFLIWISQILVGPPAS